MLAYARKGIAELIAAQRAVVEACAPAPAPQPA
jgi:hypothetical protein